VTQHAVQQAVEITKVAVQAGSWISSPDAVAKFIEVVAAKINELDTKKTS